MTVSSQSTVSLKVFWLTVIFIILAAFFFRFYRLTDHPLGITFDPAINGLDAVRLLQRNGNLPIFFPTNGGREPLHVYTLLPSIWMFGTTPFAVRAVTATFSLLSVVLLFAFLYNINVGKSSKLRNQPSPSNPLSQWGSRVSGGGEGIYRFWLAALASLTLAISYWPIVTGRLGLRTELSIFLSIPIVWLFLKGWDTTQKRWFIFSGLLLGLLGYTYSAARLLPVILVLAILPELLFKPADHHRRSSFVVRHLANLLLFALAAAISYLPMLWYLYTHPIQFANRAFSVMIWNFLDTPADIITEMGRNTLRVIGFFCCTGSDNPIFGLPEYPGSHPVLVPFLLAGLIGALIRWRSLFPRLIVLWWVVGIAPSIITIEAPHPLRMILAIVPTAILIALGPVYLVQWVVSKKQNIIAGRLLPLAIPLILYPVLDTSVAYFQDWTDLQVTRGAFDYGSIAIRDAVLEETTADVPVYLPLSRLNFPTLLFYLSGTFQREARLSVPASKSAVVISPDRNFEDATWVQFRGQTATILPPLTEQGQQLIQMAIGGSTIPIRTEDGEVIAHLVRLTADPVQFIEQPAQPANASFGPVKLVGANYPPVINPAADLPVTLFWQASGPINTEYDILVRLVDDARRVWGNGDARPTDWVYPTTFWQPGLDEIAAQHIIKMESDTPKPGRYWLAVSVFDPTTGQRLLLDSEAGESPDTVFIGPLKVGLLPADPAEIRLMDIGPVTYGENIQLTGVAVEETTIAPGELIEVNLLWHTLNTPAKDYTVFLHMFDSGGNLVAGNDTQPVEGRYPTGIWTPGEVVPDRHTLATPGTLPIGQYTLAVGLYHQPSGERLPVILSNGQENTEGRWVLEPIITVR